VTQAGAISTRNKRAKGAQVAMDIRNMEYSGRGQLVHVVEPKHDAAKHEGLCPNSKKFWRLLGGSPLDVAPAAEGGSDDMFEAFVDSSSVLQVCTVSLSVHVLCVPYCMLRVPYCMLSVSYCMLRVPYCMSHVACFMMHSGYWMLLVGC
jgi:hypothetical protein